MVAAQACSKSNRAQTRAMIPGTLANPDNYQKRPRAGTYCLLRHDGQGGKAICLGLRLEVEQRWLDGKPCGRQVVVRDVVEDRPAVSDEEVEQALLDLQDQQTLAA